MADDKEKSIKAGCDDYISKPIEPKELLLKIKNFFDWLDKKKKPTQPKFNFFHLLIQTVIFLKKSLLKNFIIILFSN